MKTAMHYFSSAMTLIEQVMGSNENIITVFPDVSE